MAKISDLVKLGYSPAVAKKIVEKRPDLAENPKPPVVAYRGLSGGASTFDPKRTGHDTDVVLTGELSPERAIRKAQEFALGVIWGNTKPSADGHYTVVEYQLPREVLDASHTNPITSSFTRESVPDESIFVSRVGDFHLQEHAPVSAIDWQEPGEDKKKE
jgi:hypothetical protein